MIKQTTVYYLKKVNFIFKKTLSYLIIKNKKTFFVNNTQKSLIPKKKNLRQHKRLINNSGNKNKIKKKKMENLKNKNK